MSHARYVFVHTFGCQMNVYDTDRMYEVLRKEEYQPTEDPAHADLILLNTCSVREKAEDKAWSMVGRYAALRERNPDLLVGLGGCMAARRGEELFKYGRPLDLAFGPDNIEELPELIKQARVRRGRQAASVKFLPRSKYRFPVAQAPTDGRVNAMVTVMKGCNKFCSFCIVPKTRGREVSKPPEEVVAEVERYVSAGVREVMLLGQNVNSYGQDLDVKGFDVRFSDLLRMVNGVEGLERIRFTTSHPWDATEDLAESFRDLSKLCPYLHLPLQSGSDRILEQMRRGYTYASYMEKIRRLREHRPGIALSTDIIVGFPGETDEEFEMTITALKEVQYDSLFSFKYSSRPDTKAADLEDSVPEDVKQKRLAKVLRTQALFTEAALQASVDQEIDVLVEGLSPRPALTPGYVQMQGRTGKNVIVNVDVKTQRAMPHSLVGRVLPVKITKARAHSLAGVLL